MGLSGIVDNIGNAMWQNAICASLNLWRNLHSDHWRKGVVFIAEFTRTEIARYQEPAH
jgi:hypothetical protein